jgi:hypothetical protein
MKSMFKLFILIFILASVNASGQKIVEGFDVHYRVTKNKPRYRVTTEAKDGRWYREAYYLPEEKLAVRAWYKDRECKIEDGLETVYYTNGQLQSTGSYINGQKEEIWLRYHENGKIWDSTFYTKGHIQGKSLGWSEEGLLVDSISGDGRGNKRETHWYPNGGIWWQGNIANDTTKVNRWSYYHKNGKILATEIFNSKGERISCDCLNEKGVRLDSCNEKEAVFSEDERAWFKFLERFLRADVPVNKGAPVGTYTIMVGFSVDVDGTLSDFKTLTNFGYGMEDEVIRLLKSSPPWKPAVWYGQLIKAYRRQPVTFRVTEE